MLAHPQRQGLESALHKPGFLRAEIGPKQLLAFS
jgi:hypothetical protein